MRSSWLISKYLVKAVLPYFIFAWLLLSVILFVQQASRFSDIFFGVNIPGNLIWQLTISLIPNVVAFTCPMAMLVATIIGLSRMQSDSELVVIRAAGVGNMQITLPIVALGVLLSIFAFWVNFQGVPIAAGVVRRVALQTAIQKLESPIEPGTFNSEVSGYTIYVREGDVVTGRWNNIFVYSQNPEKGTIRLTTSRQGRIDATGQLSEMVLENATATTIPMEPGSGAYVSENIGEIRIAIKTKRGEMIESLSNSSATFEELGLAELADYASSLDGRDRIEAQLLWQRRIILSLTPLIFCILGSAMILRFNRGGRGLGVLLALFALIGYFLLAFLGEQLARMGAIGAPYAGVIPLGGSLIAILWFNFGNRIGLARDVGETLRSAASRFQSPARSIQVRNVFVDLTTGLRDFDIVLDLIKYFLLTLGFLVSIYQIFTAFELWRYAGGIDQGISLLIKYLVYLLPYLYLQLAPSAAMIATLATYVIKSRRNEIVTWTSAGQSVYRLLLPCFVLTFLLGLLNWQIQERVLPGTNAVQDSTRRLLRNHGQPEAAGGRVWLADDDNIFSFVHASDNDTATGPRSDDTGAVGGESASDNEKQDTSCGVGCVRSLRVYQFQKGQAELQTLYRADSAIWEHGHVLMRGKVEKDALKEGKVETSFLNGADLPRAENPFSVVGVKPSHLNSSEIKEQLTRVDSESERLTFMVALEKKYATLVLPLVVALFTAPFALSLSRKGKAVTVGYAIGLWLLFTGVSSVFEQLGLNGLLPAQIAVWSPLVFFSMLGVYLLSKVRT